MSIVLPWAALCRSHPTLCTLVALSLFTSSTVWSKPFKIRPEGVPIQDFVLEKRKSIHDKRQRSERDDHIDRWAEAGATAFVGSVHGNDKHLMRSMFDQFATLQLGEGVDLSGRLTLLVELLSSDLGEGSSERTYAFAKAYLDSINIRSLNRDSESAYLVGKLYKDFLNDSEKAEEAFWVVLQPLLGSRSKYKDASFLLSRFESITSEVKVTSEQTRSYHIILKQMERYELLSEEGKQKAIETAKANRTRFPDKKVSSPPRLMTTPAPILGPIPSE